VSAQWNAGARGHSWGLVDLGHYRHIVHTGSASVHRSLGLYAERDPGRPHARHVHMEVVGGLAILHLLDVVGLLPRPMWGAGHERAQQDARLLSYKIFHVNVTPWALLVVGPAVEAPLAEWWPVRALLTVH
jgi:hypothetical protein